MPQIDTTPGGNSGKTALVVLGMHRSGTSALTHALSRLGARLPKNLLPKLENNNPEGFWESTDVLRINEMLLEEIGSRWDDWSRIDLEEVDAGCRNSFFSSASAALQENYHEAPLIALKDPRICRIYPFWQQALDACGYATAPVLIVRNPMEVARSLAARDNFSLAKSVALWLRHVLDAEITTRDQVRAIVTYDQLVGAPIKVLSRIAGDFGLDETPVRQNYEADPVLKQDQRHHVIDVDELADNKVTCGWARDVYLALSRIAEGSSGNAELDTLDKVRINFEDSLDVFGPMTRNAASVARKADQADRFSASLATGSHTLDAMKSRLEAASAASARSRLKLERAQGTIRQCTQAMENQRHRIGRLGQLVKAEQNSRALLRAVLTRMPSMYPARRAIWKRFACLIPVVFKLKGMLETGKWRETARLMFAIARYDLFDQTWYMSRYRVPRGSYAELLAHWLSMGWKEGYSPCAEFNAEHYLESHEDIRASGQNPLFHYLTHGARESRNCGFYLDADWYAQTYPDVPEGTLRALTHFRSHGRHEGRQPNALFEPRHYQIQRPQLALGDCLTDYILQGSLLDLQPSPRFEPGKYRKRMLLGHSADQEPLEHCLRLWRKLDEPGREALAISPEAKQALALELSGRGASGKPSEQPRSGADVDGGSCPAEPNSDGASGRRDPVAKDRVLAAIDERTYLSAGVMALKSLVPRAMQPKLRLFLLRSNFKLKTEEFRKVCAAFDADYYLSSYPELATMDCPAIEHYLRNGWREGRNPSADFNTCYYMEHNPDIAKPEINPFIHWVLHGRAERRPAIPHKMRLSNQHYLPLVTCIVPNFNHERFLRKRLDSILDQTYPRIEIVILDDCSTDGSRALIEAYAHEHPDRIRTVFNDTGSGSVFRQWQKGMKLARGELTWICESDDFCEPDFLAGLVPLFSDRSVQLAFGRIQFCDQDGTPYPGLDTYREQAESGIWSEVRIWPACRWFKGGFGVRNVIPNVGGCLWRTQRLPDEVWSEACAYRVVGDWYLYSMLAAGGQIAWNPAAVAYFRQHQKNTSVGAFTSEHYYVEHHRLMASLQEQWGLPPTTIDAFYHHLKQHCLAVEGKDAIRKLDSCVNPHELSRIVRRRDHVLIAFLGFHPGGGEFFPIRLANSLHARGMRVSLLALDMGRINSSMLESLATGIPVYDAAYLSEYGVDAFLQDAGVSLIHSHMISVEWFFFGKEKIRTNLPYVVTMHGSYESSPLKSAQLEPLVKRVTYWVYLAEKNLEPLKALDIPSERVVKLPNAVPLDERPFPMTRKELGIEDEAIVFTLVARGIRRKGWRAAILAFLKLSKQPQSRPVHLILAGEGDYVDELSTRYNQEPGIHFVGFQSCIQGLYRLSDVALVPTRFEGESFPLCIIEAYMSGIPVIATDIGEIPGMVVPGNDAPGGILVDQIRNTDAFIDRVTAAMLRMMDEDTRKKLTGGARTLARSFDMDALTERYMDVYQEARQSFAETHQDPTVPDTAH